VACELVPVSESGSEDFQEEEFYGQRLPPQFGAFGMRRPETKYPRDGTLTAGNDGLIQRYGSFVGSKNLEVVEAVAANRSPLLFPVISGKTREARNFGLKLA
jgi:hypothetical protein